MNNEEIKKLVRKYQEKSASEEEKEMLYAWYIQYAKHKKSTPPPDDIWVRQLSSLEIIQNTRPQQKPKTNRIITLTRKYRKAIASIAAMLVLAIGYQWYTLHRPNATPLHTDTSDIHPATETATLTLADGRSIAINPQDHGEIIEQDGIKISKNADGQIVYEIKDADTHTTHFNTITTGRGERIKIKLTDGTLVYLNAASSLKFPTNFNNTSKRKVMLSGESYFEVAKHPSLQFVVSTKKQEVQVLGTHFNINAYPEDNSEITTLLEGAVHIVSGKNHVKLKPGEQSTNSDDKLEVTKVDIQNAVDWIAGDFYFDQADLNSVMNKIARWYNVDVVYESVIAANVKASGLISREKKLAEVLQSIEKAGNVKFRIQGKTVIVSNR